MAKKEQRDAANSQNEATMVQNEAAQEEKPVEKKRAGFDNRIAAVAVIAVAVVAIAVFLLAQQSPAGTGYAGLPDAGSGIKTFKQTSGPVDAVDGKPVVRLFSTTWCPHCQWIKETFDSEMKKYVAEGKIIAYHWEVDTGDNALTDAVETAVPESEMAIFSANGGGSVPTFVFGGKYVRVGNGFESQNPSDVANPESVLSKQHLEQEKQEYAAVIAQLLKEIGA